MNLIKYSFCSFLFILLFGCSDSGDRIDTIEKSSFFKRIEIRQADIQDSLTMSTVIRDYDFLPLETNSSSLIKEVFKIEDYGSGYVLVDKYVGSCVISFDKQGKFINKYGSKGTGFGSYVIPMDFALDHQNNELLILNSEKHKINFYDLNTSKLKKVKSYNFPCHSLTKIDNNIFFFGGAARRERMIITDSNFKKIKGYIPYSDRYSIGLINQVKSLSDSEALYRLSFNDTIYKIKRGKVAPYMLIDFGEKKFTDEKYEALTEVQRQRLDDYTLDYMTNLTFFDESPTEISFIFSYKKDQYVVFLNKKNGEKRIFPRRNSRDDVTFLEQLPGPLGVDQEGYFLSIITAPKFLAAAKRAENFAKQKNITAEQRERVNKILETAKVLTQESNPVLFKFKMSKV